MAAVEALNRLRGLDLVNATVSVWAFKKSASRTAKFRASSVVATPELKIELKRIARQWIDRCTEVEDYSLIATINESSCLYLESDETTFPQLQDLVSNPSEEHLIEAISDLEGSLGYLVRLTIGTDTLDCVCRLGNDWKVKKRAHVLNLVLNRNQLDLASDEAFIIPKRFDFFVLNTDILVTNKGHFESVLEYKQTYVTSFTELRADAGFQAIFSDMAVLIDHVGSNTMHLRRMAVVQERGYYNDVAFMEKLRLVNHERQWNIIFDDNGKIVPSDESVRAIIQVLLNHRLHSELTGHDFDVPSANPIA
ncbi:Kiwa anti-phage protein KwaB-like domain-containing protein [Pseudomonas sp. PGPR40]|uniref:Kiwa anti-phage protein KwaB-like domain-containing protein n=1 Tax=Pseudomonas sp. PGPR40 TaxID=2913476 RepID=UPI001EDAE730|nr:Kiwa anti-phage protein KwaB-like domain-containing protein [Pseudomonas sp. PGPR40]